MIKQMDLFNVNAAERNLQAAEDAYEQLVPQQWGEPELNEAQLKARDHLEHQRERWVWIKAQERELSELIYRRWTVIATYPLSDGMDACRLILYKDDE